MYGGTQLITKKTDNNILPSNINSLNLSNNVVRFFYTGYIRLLIIISVIIIIQEYKDDAIKIITTKNV